MSDTKLLKEQLCVAIARAEEVVSGGEETGAYSGEAFMACALLNARNGLIANGVSEAKIESILRGEGL